MRQNELEGLRSQVTELNVKMLDLINDRMAVVQEIGKVKEKQGVNRYDPVRERDARSLERREQRTHFKWYSRTSIQGYFHVRT